MDRPACLVVRKDVVKQDPALQPGARGARKLLVTKVFATKEDHATTCEWKPPVGEAKCPVHVMFDTEAAVFTQGANQDRHYHKKGTEAYVVLDGEMAIEVEGQLYRLWAGDEITVFPNAVHEVRPDGTAFLCFVFTTNCGGADDKFLAEKAAEICGAPDRGAS